MRASIFKYPSSEHCPDPARHTSEPRGYLHWHAWAEEMAKTHRQERCPRCGFWAIWVLRNDGSEA